MTHVLHRAWRNALRKLNPGRGVYVMASTDGVWHCLFAQRKGCRLLAIIGMGPDGRPRRGEVVMNGGTSSFVRMFEAEVHIQYQQMCSKLRNTIRTKNNVAGYSTTFMPVGNNAPDPIECILQDCYGGRELCVRSRSAMTYLRAHSVGVIKSASALLPCRQEMGCR